MKLPLLQLTSGLPLAASSFASTFCFSTPAFLTTSTTRTPRYLHLHLFDTFYSPLDFPSPTLLLLHMDSSLHELWQTASGSPFKPTVGKGSQFFVGFSLLVLGLALTGSFFLSMSTKGSIISRLNLANFLHRPHTRQRHLPRSSCIIGTCVCSIKEKYHTLAPYDVVC